MGDETLFHAYPGRPGFPRYTIDLVSPEAPSGAGWLANCFIELGLPAWKPWNADDRAHWIDLGGHRYRHRLDGSPWSRVLPALTDGRELEFRAGEAVRVHHVWPGVYPRTERTILFLRDPCDALHSAWHRRVRSGTIAGDTDFGAFCASRFHHYPVSWADYLLLFLRVWRVALCDFGGIVVSFEAYRRDAYATLAETLDRLAIRATAADIARAVEASSLARIREAERNMLAAGVVATALVRAEPPGDASREHGDSIGAIARRFDEITRALGDPIHSPTTRVPQSGHERETTATALLHAIGKAGVPIESSGWLAGAIRSCCGDIDLVPDA
jgi:hypothetical protein